MSARLNWMLIGLAVLIAAAPMILNIPGEYGGADDRAKSAIEETGYQPWFDSIWEPPSGEIASMLFALQAALGAGVVGYVVGRLHGRRERQQ
ncbi:energy-coupling factor ABC transporter substrate-binding protein [Magnetospirillum sulfuroxidans]|uniref:Cobalt transport protein CbiN n=1 Tax=Magnetospirillum sulfuroxidans TaxID=611300 RepID=A0ABS5ICH1_9PROT|nr:energy-coupling factor ABC transporter substrate-binding protein [Magnetospirillum sulfuroxidans]MBR9971986.1 energy-coupling factor ABC transporter substrate-binding protein [Magnetospirillum sulfuroxidans]